MKEWNKIEEDFREDFFNKKFKNENGKTIEENACDYFLSFFKEKFEEQGRDIKTRIYDFNEINLLSACHQNAGYEDWENYFDDLIKSLGN